MKDSDSLLMRYLDGECPPEERSAVDQRLRDDPAAADELALLSRQREPFAALPPVLSELEIESDWNRVKATILTEEAPEDTGRTINWMAWSKYWTWGAAAAVFALASVIFFLPHQEVSASPADYNIVDTVETDIEGATPIIFVDKQSGWSVVWVDEAAAS